MLIAHPEWYEASSRFLKLGVSGFWRLWTISFIDLTAWFLDSLLAFIDPNDSIDWQKESDIEDHNAFFGRNLRPFGSCIILSVAIKFELIEVLIPLS